MKKSRKYAGELCKSCGVPHDIGQACLNPKCGKQPTPSSSPAPTRPGNGAKERRNDTSFLGDRGRVTGKGIISSSFRRQLSEPTCSRKRRQKPLKGWAPDVKDVKSNPTRWFFCAKAIEETTWYPMAVIIDYLHEVQLDNQLNVKKRMFYRAEIFRWERR